MHLTSPAIITHIAIKVFGDVPHKRVSFSQDFFFVDMCPLFVKISLEVCSNPKIVEKKGKKEEKKTGKMSRY